MPSAKETKTAREKERYRKQVMEREGNYEGNKPLLYLVATPIGNIEELSPRAISVLKEMDYIACEDTRNSGLLFSRCLIKKPLISCHEHNEEEAAAKIIDLLKSGKKVAYVSDAGYPTVSDPGTRLVKKAVKEDVKVAVVNGPSASICALAGSGIDTAHYYFEGFLPSKPSEAKRELEELKERKETLIFYESPHRIERTLKTLSDTLGGDRNACLARELTKIHEEYIRASLRELSEIDPSTLLGEIVIIVEGKRTEEKPLTDKEIKTLLFDALKTCRGKEAVSKVAKDNALPKNRVYDLYLEIKGQ